MAVADTEDRGRCAWLSDAEMVHAEVKGSVYGIEEWKTW